MVIEQQRKRRKDEKCYTNMAIVHLKEIGWSYYLIGKALEIAKPNVIFKYKK